MKTPVTSRLCALALIIPLALRAVGPADPPSSVPGIINYQGRVTVSGVNFTGTGQFKFALVDGGVNLNRAATTMPPMVGPGGTITLIPLSDGGAGYTSEPVVTISNANGGMGSGATATASIGAGGVVTEIIVTNPGSGYSTAAGAVVVTIAPPPQSLLFTSYWSNDSTSIAGSEPASSVALGVNAGLYAVPLGDTALTNMQAIPASVFQNSDVRLRVWFDDGTHGSQLLTPDQRLVSAPYAMHAAKADSVDSAAITTVQLADDAVTSAKLAPAAVTVESLRLANGGAFSSLFAEANDGPLVGGLIGFDANGNFTLLEGTAVGWTLGGNAGTTGANFLGTTDNQPLAFRVNGNTALTIDTSTDLMLPPIHPDFLGFPEQPYNGLGMYNTRLFGDGRLFGGVNVRGPVLYGAGGGALGIKTAGIFGGVTEKAVLQWDNYSISLKTDFGIKMSAFDGPIVTRGFDLFRGDAIERYVGHGRWGMFMEQGQLVLGIPDTDVGQRGFSIGAYQGTGTFDELCHIDNNSGRFVVKGLAANGGERAYLGGDGNGDVEFGSLNPAVTLAAFWNPASNKLLDVKVRTLIIEGGADLAEPFAMGGGNALPKGTVVVIDDAEAGRLKQSTREYDTCVAGIISGANGIRPGIAMKQEGVNESGQQVALTGRVYCKADASFGAIKPGDLLTTSPTPGHAMKVTDHSRAQGAVLGKAMSALDEGTGFVLVLVTLQ